MQTPFNCGYRGGHETRPSTFKPDYVRQVRELYAQGFADRELAEVFGVARNTIFRWRAAYPDFAEATRLGKSAAGDRITVRMMVMVSKPTPGSSCRFSVPIQHHHPAATAAPDHAG
ncbi:helix-turn-helix domain-containing protein [Sphingomonas sp. So64.6b]|nr:helix-turn-helix domain-containing protein [Sphingomonas sp. So64.6b]